MGLNIKNERVHDLARALARRLNTSQTSAIEQALSRMLADLDAQTRPDQRDEIDRILADIDGRLDDHARELLTTDDLYDDRGMPA